MGFCGDLDVPDWLLAGIAILAKISSLRLKVLCQQLLKIAMREEHDWEKVTKITSDAKLSTADTKQALNCLHFMLCQAGRFGVEEKPFADELTMLGLPKESADQVARAYREAKERLQHQLHETSLQLPHISDVRWKVEHVLAASGTDVSPSESPVIQLQCVLTGGGPPLVGMELSTAKFRALHSDLRVARELMGRT
eukprot:NODE_1906_length_729_cov_98.057353_g1603_i0.p1 GENE.NODE_1906_length_729_cov_98.057353_g1603_i0~~NODE_1906_length_729_cov_98.057353_g1603_i0.p1  ORF type:complete len:206 (-),score=28.35 NODE_1906_length_729_cov_98.057353_g1603_i0:111-698(-)